MQCINILSLVVWVCVCVRYDLFLALATSSSTRNKLVNQAAESVTFYIRRNRYFDVPINVLVKLSGFIDDHFYRITRIINF